MNWTAVIWSLIFAVGSIIAVYALRDVAADRAALRGRNGMNQMNLTMRERRLWVALVAILMHLAIGIVALLPVDFPGEGMLVLVGLFGGGVGFILFVLLEIVDRATLRRNFP